MLWDVTGLGNALMDALVVIDDDSLLEELGLTRGMMHLVDDQGWTRVFDRVKDREVVFDSGGSCANSIATVGRLGGRGIYCGQVGSDDLGALYASKMVESCGIHALQTSVAAPTGKCLSIVSRHDAERTMVTDLGAAVALPALDTFSDHLKRTQIAHFTGYTLLDGPMRPVVAEAFRTARDAGAVLSLDVADPFVVTTIRDLMWEVLEKWIDVVFLNAEEARALTDRAPEEAAQIIADRAGVRTVVVKHGARGSTVLDGGRTYQIQAEKVDAIDTTGAGDAYAGGYLYGMSMGWTPDRCGALASAIAAKAVCQVGAVVKDVGALGDIQRRFGTGSAAA